MLHAVSLHDIVLVASDGGIQEVGMNTFHSKATAKQ